MTEVQLQPRRGRDCPRADLKLPISVGASSMKNGRSGVKSLLHHQQVIYPPSTSAALWKKKNPRMTVIPYALASPQVSSLMRQVPILYETQHWPILVWTLDSRKEGGCIRNEA